MYFYVSALGHTVKAFYLDRITDGVGPELLLELGIYGHKRQGLAEEFRDEEYELTLSEDEHVLALCFSYMERKGLSSLSEVIDTIIEAGSAEVLFVAYY
ncbi:MAG: hypothetical protein HZA95_00795 [Candidatus Vogelbacteria bacterium]|nr:hypothetical protein [Candidatus Vogelbacteria bacterium]